MRRSDYHLTLNRIWTCLRQENNRTCGQHNKNNNNKPSTRTNNPNTSLKIKARNQESIKTWKQKQKGGGRGGSYAMIKRLTNDLLICIFDLCILTMRVKRNWNHNRYKPSFECIIITTTTTTTSAQSWALKTKRQRMPVCNKGWNVPNFGSNNKSVYK